MEIANLLEQLGIPHNLSGFAYIEKMIQACMDGYTGKLMPLYEAIGKECNVTGKGVERAVRHAIEVAMNRNPDFFSVFGLPDFCWARSFSNSEFLRTAVYRIKSAKDAEKRRKNDEI